MTRHTTHHYLVGKIIRLSASIIVLAGCILNARATVYYTIGGTADLQDVDVVFKDPSIGYNYSGDVLAGGIQISQLGGKNTPIDHSMPLNYVTVCTDFRGSLYIGSTYQYATPAAPFKGATGIDPTWNNPALAIQNAAQIFYTDGDLGSGGLGTGKTPGFSLTDMVALQLAVWICLYDTTSSGTISFNANSEFYVSTASNSGNSVDTAAITIAEGWVANLTGNYHWVGDILEPYDPSNPTQNNPDGQLPQELLIGVPEPTTVLAGALLLVPLGLSTIRIIRKGQNRTN